jgi:hypothetical protein
MSETTTLCIALFIALKSRRCWGSLPGSVGHEWCNPLGVMNNAVYFLQAVLSDADETIREYLNIIEDEITGSEHIVSGLLDSVRTKPPQLEAVGVLK